jgi:hypothetical protein
MRLTNRMIPATSAAAGSFVTGVMTISIAFDDYLHVIRLFAAGEVAVGRGRGRCPS